MLQHDNSKSSERSIVLNCIITAVGRLPIDNRGIPLLSRVSPPSVRILAQHMQTPPVCELRNLVKSCRSSWPARPSHLIKRPKRWAITCDGLASQTKHVLRRNICLKPSYASSSCVTGGKVEGRLVGGSSRRVS